MARSCLRSTLVALVVFTFVVAFFMVGPPQVLKGFNRRIPGLHPRAAWILDTMAASSWMACQVTRSTGLTRLSKWVDAKVSWSEEVAWKYWELQLMGKLKPLKVPVYKPGMLVDTSQPLVFRKAHKAVSAAESKLSLTLDGLRQPPLSEIEIDYFSDARRPLDVVPDSRGRVGDIVARIVDENSFEKFGTLWIVKKFREPMLRQLEFPEIAAVWGNHSLPLSDLWTLEVPVFVARGADKKNSSNQEKKDDAAADSSSVAEGKEEDKPRKSKEEDTAGKSKDVALSDSPRTDLHCEPITNLAIQIDGRKRWTLVSADYWHFVKPRLAPDNRPYFYSNLDPLNRSALDLVPHYEVITGPGDVLLVPAWTWHRVEYLPGEAALSASLFRFMPFDFAFNNPLFAINIIPDIIKEAVGWTTQ